MSPLPKELVVQAFHAAKAKGKPDWHRMTLAVLKNRLLDLSDRTFDESNYGAANLREFVERMPELLTLDLSAYPPAVELRSVAAAEDVGNETHTSSDENARDEPFTIFKDGRIRPDLWKAIVDYSSGTSYVWDEGLGRARAERREDAMDLLPTISPAELHQWRSEFKNDIVSGLDNASSKALEDWLKSGATRDLPSPLVPKWHATLKRKVATRLEEWFRKDQSGEDRLEEARRQGDALSVGEIHIAIAVSTNSEDTREQHLSRAIAAWSRQSVLHGMPTVFSDLVADIQNYVPDQLAAALVQVSSRCRAANAELPAYLNDLAFRLSDSFSRIYETGGKARPKDAIGAAVALTEEAFAQLRAAVQAFTRSTAVTAKLPSIEVVKASHKYAQVALAAEVALLREVEVLLGPLFRKFCESCERHEASEVPRRALELTRYIERFHDSTSNLGHSRMLAEIVSPLVDHVGALIEEGTRASDELMAPQVSNIGGVFKLDLKAATGKASFPMRVQNSGHGTAYGLRLKATREEGPQISIAEPVDSFDLSPSAERLVKVFIGGLNGDAEFELPVQWECETANGTTCQFRQELQFLQQNVEPDWEQLLTHPPYAINPVRRREDLYGRDAILSDLEIYVASGTSTFLWGQKRVGKTSLLQVLAHQLATSSTTTCVFLRMGELASMHEGQIAHTIAERLSRKQRIAVECPREEYFGAGLGRLVPFVEDVSEKDPNGRILVIVDEFDDLDPAFYTGERGKQFVKALRSLSEVGLTLFFVGSERMDSIYRSHSVDLNKWLNVSLDRLESQEDCAALIRDPVSNAIEYDDTAIRRIIDQCDGNPFYMHLLCSAVFRRCCQERRTFVGENDVQNVQRDLLRSIGPTNFSHLWEDVPELDRDKKSEQVARNCLFLSCVAALGGAYDSLEELVEAQSSQGLDSGQQLTTAELKEVETSLLRRQIIGPSRHNSSSLMIRLPLFRDWAISNASAELMPTWRSFLDKRCSEEPDPHTPPPYYERAGFPIAEDDLLPVSENLIYLGKQKDVAEVRRWLSQFDDENRIEIAFLLLQRLVENGFVNEGASINALSKMQECIQAKRLEIGGGSWNIVRRRLDNLCIAYVDSEVKSGAATARDLSKRVGPGRCAGIAEIQPWLNGHMDSDPILAVVDDFAGTGSSLSKGLKKLEQQCGDLFNQLAEEGRIVCCIESAFPEAITKLYNDFPEVKVMVTRVFDDSVRAFDLHANIFESESEVRFARDFLLQIGRQLVPQNPLGYGDMGALVAFHNTIPNNTLPVFWSSGTVNDKPWKPLLPRASFG